MAVLSAGVVALVGWILDVRILKGFLPGMISMKVNTALGFVFAGFSLFRLAPSRPSRRDIALGASAAALATVIGGLTLLEDIGRADFGIDQALVTDAREDGNPGAAGRMAPSSAYTFVLLGVALLCLATSRRAFRVAGHAAVLAAAASSVVAMTAYLLDVTLPLYGYSQMALHTATLFVALCFGILCARPEGGMMDVAMADHAGGAATRRLLPIVIVVPVLFGWLRLEGQRAGLYDTATGILLFTFSVVITFTVLVWRSGRTLGIADEERRRVDARLRESETRWRQLADAMPQIVWSAGPDGWIDYADKSRGAGADPDNGRRTGYFFDIDARG